MMMINKVVIDQRRRRNLLTLLALAAVTPARSQISVRLPRVGFLDPSPAKFTQSRVRQFRAGLARLGYEDGKHYVLEYRSAEGQFDRLHTLATELVLLPVRVMVVRNTPGTLAGRQATRTIPLVMADVGDPVELGFVQSLARPGGNVTGPSNATLELLRKRLELLLDAFPSGHRIAILSNSADQNTPLQISEVQSAAARLRVELRVFDVRSEGGIDGALKQISAWKPNAMLPLVNPIYRSDISPRIVAWVPQHLIPVMHAFREEVEAGGLFAYSADLSDHYERVAVYVARLLNGADPATLPIDRPTRFELTVNLKTAKALGITFSHAVLARADRVIE
jgi:putative ABC transport system substrate-binding protein